MIIYLLKFSACLAIFMVFYNLFLEKTSVHNFKRFYLLAIVILALGIPLITFIHYVEPVVNTTIFTETPQISFEQQAIYQPTLLDYLPQILWSIYGLGVLIFGIKFLRNLSQIISKIKRNPKHKTGSFTNVLLLDLIIPHTFFNYIFLNKTKYETQQIPEEVLLHEATHATQKHSLDVLFIELLQIVFWFNPLIYFIKHSIKLNHEFLADQAVLNKGITASTYQHILLAFSSPDHYRDALEPKLANAINYSSIRLKIFGKDILLSDSFGQVKKRFTVMKTHTSKQKIWLRSFLLLPLIGLTLYGFSETKVVEKESSNQVSRDKIIKDVVIYVDKNDKLLINGKSVKLENLSDEINKLNTNLTQEQKRKFLSANIQYEDEKNIDIIKKIQSVLVKSDIWSSSTTNVETLKQLGMPSALPKNKYAGKTIEEANSIYDKETIDLSPPKENDPNSPWQIGIGVSEVTYVETDDKPENITPEMIDEYNSIIKDINSKPEGKRIIKLKDANRLALIYSQMSDEQKESALPLPKSYENPSIEVTTPKTSNQNSPWQIGVGVSEVTYDKNDTTQQKATPEELSEYNKLAKQYNAQPEDKRVVKMKDLKRLEYIFNKMSKEQKTVAEPFPNCPPPPPPPAPKVMKGNNVPPPPPIPANTTAAQKKKMQAAIDNYNTQVPPPPPPPKSPLDHIIEMAKKSATFYYEGKSISSDEAIKLLKENNKLNVSTTQSNTNPLKVSISKEPITINPQTKSKDLVMINGKKMGDNAIQLTKDELKNAKLTVANSEVVKFMFKIPGKKTESISGKTLNSTAISNLENIPVGSAIQFFMIKDSNNAVHPPILISIIE